MIYIIIGIILLYISFKHTSDALMSVAMGWGGSCLIVIIPFIMIVANYENRKLYARYEFNACSIYRINDEIAQHRAFYDDLWYGFSFSEDIAELPLVHCSKGKLIKSYPWIKK